MGVFCILFLTADSDWLYISSDFQHFSFQGSFFTLRDFDPSFVTVCHQQTFWPFPTICGSH